MFGTQFGLCDCLLCIDKASHRLGFFFGSWLLIHNWKILLLYAWWLLADGFNTVSPDSVRQANTPHLWLSCTALMLFSAPIFWGFFEFFYHKKVSLYYIINLRKSFFLSFLLFFLEIFLIPTTMRTGPELVIIVQYLHDCRRFIVQFRTSV